MNRLNCDINWTVGTNTCRASWIAHYCSWLICFLTAHSWTLVCSRTTCTHTHCRHSNRQTLRHSELFFHSVQFATFSIPLCCHNGISGQMDWSVSPVCWSWLEGFRFKTCWWPQVVALNIFFFISSDFLFLCSYHAHSLFPLPSSFCFYMRP